MLGESWVHTRTQWYADERQAREWSAVTAVLDLDESQFTWAGPSRELPTGLAG